MRWRRVLLVFAVAACAACSSTAHGAAPVPKPAAKAAATCDTALTAAVVKGRAPTQKQLAAVQKACRLSPETNPTGSAKSCQLLSSSSQMTVIKECGTNGGGYFNINTAHPNP